MWSYSKTVNDFIAENVSGQTTKDLANLVNRQFGTAFTEGKMKSYKKNHDLKSGTVCGLPAGRPSDRYPEAIKEFIVSNCIGTGRPQMAELLNRTFCTNYTASQMKSYYTNHKIKCRISTRFEKGHVSANKGSRGVHLSPETEFKNGQMPHNYKPIGTETWRGDGYLYVKIADPKKWRPKHILLWEAENGTLPEGHRLLFADQNRQNIQLDNLILITRGQLATLNRLHLIHQNKPATETGIILAALASKMCARTKQLKGRKNKNDERMASVVEPNRRPKVLQGLSYP